ncbi:uncharacterized protein LOC141909093 isoform X2 [Tubulanus polymorphus]|uniref:uncharacterized protein LOC141909093 isoform X2 n=1 Tax=Tubulanus polymorphus TaxID=672921 RepID=UPI003DA2C327
MHSKYHSGFRLICVVVFLYYSFLLTWQGLVVFMFLLESTNTRKDKKNPLRQNITGEVTLLDATRRRIDAEIARFVTYDGKSANSLSRFDEIKFNSECIFAAKARLWGSSDWLSELPLEENIHRLLPTFLLFVLSCPELGLDGFLVELPGSYCCDIQIFSDTVRRVLKVMSDEDPRGVRCMDKSYIGGRGWVFEFNKMTFFVTTFAPFYPETHSRYSFGCRDHGYILFQPELSFARKDLPTYTPVTNWNNPRTIRDRIRVAFRDAGRPYPTHEVPLVEEIVRPVDSCDQIKWWNHFPPDQFSGLSDTY